MSGDTIILAGRGPSIRRFDWPDDVPVAAISSGVFALPKPPEHFITLETPGYFAEAESPIEAKRRTLGIVNWRNDADIEWWPILEDARVRKHVPLSALDMWSGIPNVTPWPVYLYEAFLNIMTDERHDTPCYVENDHRAMALRRPINSIMFAVQLVAWMGYRRIIFAGCDLSSPAASPVVAILREWHPLAAKDGCEWVASSRESRLSEFLPVLEAEAAAA